MILGFIGVAVLAAAVWGPIASMVEHPKYLVEATYGDVELRVYAPQIVARVSVEGDRGEAIGSGFRVLADYIFGNTASAEKIAMTAPVTQQRGGAKIAMTAPVLQQPQSADTQKWTVSFVMPAEYTLDTLPKPNNPDVEILAMPSRRVAALRFSGMYGDDKLAAKTAELMTVVTDKKLMPMGQPVYAFYNPPWTLPFLRRNEVMIEVAP